MELILAILFFSVASAVCVQFFVKSHLLNLDSNILIHAVNECSGAAEILTTADSLTGGLALLQDQYPKGKYPDLDVLSDLVKSLAPADVLSEDSTIQIYYDQSFLPCAEASASYVLDIQLTYSGQMMDIILEMKRSIRTREDSDIPIYQLKTKHYTARSTQSHER